MQIASACGATLRRLSNRAWPGRNSEFCCRRGDMHGVHDWPTDNWDGKKYPWERNKPRAYSSPVTAVNPGSAPPCFIHGDAIAMSLTQTVRSCLPPPQKGVGDRAAHFPLPDDVHDFPCCTEIGLAAYHATTISSTAISKSAGNRAP